MLVALTVILSNDKRKPQLCDFDVQDTIRHPANNAATLSESN